MLFDPDSSASRAKKKDQGRRNVEAWVRSEWSASEKLVANLQKEASDLKISVREVACTDPECAPIDTYIAIFATSGMSAEKIPKEVELVTEEDVKAILLRITPRLLNQVLLPPAKHWKDTLSFRLGLASILAASIAAHHHSVPGAAKEKTKSALAMLLIGTGGLTLMIGSASLLYSIYSLASSKVSQDAKHRARSQHASLKRSRFAADTGLRIPLGCPCCDPRAIMAER